MLTENLIEEIERVEGFIAKGYLDGKGKNTIGYGTPLDSDYARELPARAGRVAERMRSA